MRRLGVFGPIGPSRAAAMDQYRYRAYVLNDNGIHLWIEIYCSDDTAARERTEQLVNGHDIELWKDDRKIAHLSKRA
jgi:hypothetical protein